MILGAGLGTRLRPLFGDLPKILAPVLGVPMLERLLAWLERGGVAGFALNTHHRAEAVRDHVTARGRLGPVPRLFHEPELLGTGGALVNASPFWGEDPLLVWNGDILCGLEPSLLLQAHQSSGAEATLAVQARPGDSHLLVDRAGRLCGIDSARRGLKRILRKPEGDLLPRAFNGISILAPSLRTCFPESGAFDLIDALLAALAEGRAIATHDLGSAPYGTTGSPGQLEALEALLSGNPDLLAGWTPACREAGGAG